MSRKLFLIALLFVTTLFWIGSVSSAQGGNANVVITEDALYIIITGNQPVSLIGLTMEADNVRYSLAQWDAFDDFRLGEVIPPICFRLQREGAKPVMPQACADANAIPVQYFTDTEVFWHNNVTQQSNTVIFRLGDKTSTSCTKGDDNCSFMVPTLRKRIFAADFEKYEAENYDCIDYYTRDGNYHAEIECPAKQARTLVSKRFNDFDAQLIAQKVDGSDRGWYGIVISVRNGGKVTDHRFLISGLGTYTYEIAHYNEDGEQVELTIVQEAEVSEAVNTEGINEIRVVRRGSDIEFWVNEEKVLDTSEITDESIPRLEERTVVSLGMVAITPSKEPGAGDNFLHVAYSVFQVFEVDN